jgi:hypothetical protein
MENSVNLEPPVMHFFILLAIVCFGFVLINMIILGLMLKLYTEILKEKSQRNRGKSDVLPAELVAARKIKATEWQIHGGNVRQHGRFMASRPDQETMAAAAAALDEAANFLLSTTISSHPPA